MKIKSLFLRISLVMLANVIVIQPLFCQENPAVAIAKGQAPGFTKITSSLFEAGFNPVEIPVNEIADLDPRTILLIETAHHERSLENALVKAKDFMENGGWVLLLVSRISNNTDEVNQILGRHFRLRLSSEHILLGRSTAGESFHPALRELTLGSNSKDFPLVADYSLALSPNDTQRIAEHTDSSTGAAKTMSAVANIGSGGLVAVVIPRTQGIGVLHDMIFDYYDNNKVAVTLVNWIIEHISKESF